MDTLLKIGIGAGVAIVAARMLQLNKLTATASVSLSKLRIHKVTLSGIEVAVTAKINNPSNVTATIVNPVVRLWNSKGAMIAESPANGKSFTIAGGRLTEVGEIMLPLSWLNILPLLGIKDITSLINLFGKDGTKGFLKSFSSPVFMSVIMQIDGMIIQTPKAIINK